MGTASRNVLISALMLLLVLYIGFYVVLPWYSATKASSDSLTFQIHSITTPTTTPPFTLISNTTTATTTAAATVNTTFNITFHVGNPNDGFVNHAANVSVYYHRARGDKARPAHDYYLSSSSVDTFCPSPSCNLTDNEAWVPVTVAVPRVPVSDDLAVVMMAEDLMGGEYGITIKVAADYRSFDRKDEYSKLSVTCKNVMIRVLDGVMVGQPRKCKVNW